MSSLQIRDAHDGDWDAVRDVTLSAYQEYAALMSPHWEDYRGNILTTLADVKPAEQIVAEQDGRIVGTVLLYPAGTVFHLPDGASASLDLPEVRLLAVVPEMRGRGLGVALMQECICRMRRSGAAALTLHTTDMMQVAMRMYGHLGFFRVPELDFRPVEGVIIKGYRFNLGD